MKKLLTLLLAVTCVCGCSQTQNPTDESKTARIPMVMVDGELYLDTGYDIYQNEKWRIFATEDVREQIQSERKNDIIQTE